MILRRVVSLCVLSFSFLLPPPTLSQTKPLKKIRVGVPSVSMGNIIIFVTREARLFEKHGLDAEVITMNGSGIASKALISGNIDISPIATPTVINANLAGADMAILAHTMPGVIHALMVKPEIKRVEELKGKKLAVSSLGSLTDFLVRYIAKKKGLNPDRDVTLIQTGGDAERIVALKSGVVDGAAMSHPGYGRAQRLGFSMLWDSAKEVDYPWMEITTRRATVQREREKVTSYMRAHLEGIALFKKDREFGKKVIKKVLRLDDEELVGESYEIFSRAFLPAPYPNIKGMKTSYEYVALTRPEVWKHKPEEFADASFVEELEKSGFIKKLYEK
ncbi:MAG: ABC transporter substrate-binding protein [Deltaproteobacteria bacterium]|nr:ABC transporter substrate-binding protein [Deltaproteobacteria bacterium]MBI2349754.1 ABC transporter substrate-binding protein [Deltaproteobacteria bacterium]MBI2539885.1 ABC transporter substrate-binding protein [Deltaproteobacteria bacterium]